MEFVLIEAGTFRAGTPMDEPMRESQETSHQVTLTRSFYLGRFEVTQAEWRAVLDERPSRFGGCGPRCPVENVSLIDIERFIAELSRRSGLSFRLPTEAEWEYACRAGGEAAFGAASSLSSEEANFDGREPYPGAAPGPYLARPTSVGTFRPNAWGVYDMSGNVWEWCLDDHCPYPEQTVTDPVGRCRSPYKVIRGGSWHFGPDSARCGLRYTHRPQDLGPSLGFRLVRGIVEP
jgi:formylglycine-generating enzyme required for sulfatase activity